MGTSSDKIEPEVKGQAKNSIAEFCQDSPQVEPWFSIGKSSKWESLIKMADRISGAHLPILVVGEYGTGKRELTQYILNQRRVSRIVHITCRKLRAFLLAGNESFLRDWHGFLGQLDAYGSATLIIQGIDEIPFELQSLFIDLIAELQNSANRNSALIATSRISPSEMLSDGRLRADLYHSIAAMELLVPALRERDDDIPLLATHFVSQTHTEQARKIRLLPNAMEMLRNYPWPGNVMELRNVIARIRAFAEQSAVDAETLSLAWKRPQPQNAAQLGNLNLEHAETQLILQAVERTSGNKTLAAKKLGISPRTLHNKIRKFRMMGLMPAE